MSTPAPHGRLPRGPHAPGLGPDETVLRRSGADLQNGWLSRHGDLIVTEDRLLFDPTPLDRFMRARRREIPLEEIARIERSPLSADAVPRGGRRPRVVIHADGCLYEFMVGDVDGWIDTMERVYQRRGRRGRPHAPTFAREGHINVLLEG